VPVRSTIAGCHDPGQTGLLQQVRRSLPAASNAAVVLGGTSLFGGKGGVLETFIAVLLLSVLRNLFNLLGLSSFFQMVVTGIILVAALIMNYVLDRRAKSA
jgi:ribose/xylose/arabinose/galactoside ABC-type transport system permease subunit